MSIMMYILLSVSKKDTNNVQKFGKVEKQGVYRMDRCASGGGGGSYTTSKNKDFISIC